MIPTPLHLDELDAAIARVGQEIAAHMDPPEQMPEAQALEQHDPDAASEQEESQEVPALTWAHAIVLLCSIPGIIRRAAEVILAEIGLNIGRFPSATTWHFGQACVRAITRVPANARDGRTRKGSRLSAATGGGDSCGSLYQRLLLVGPVPQACRAH